MEVGSLTDSYLALFQNRTPWEFLFLFLLGLARIVPIVALAPFLGAKVLPDTMKILFGVALVPIFFPLMLLKSGDLSGLSLDLLFAALVLKEILIGSLLGFIISLPFYVCQSAGVLIEHQMGAQSLQVNDPTTQSQSSPIGVLYLSLMTVIFFLIGGPALFFEGLANAYTLVAPDQFLPADFFTLKTPLAIYFLKVVNHFMVVSLQLAAPALIALLMSDLFLGIANRMAPQVQISFLLWSMKAYVGVLVLWLGWWFVLKQMDLLGLNWVHQLLELIKKAF